MSDFALIAGSWLLTFLLHSTVWLGGAWLLLRQFPSVTPAARDWVWKGVFLGSLLSPTLQVGGTSLLGWDGLHRSLALETTTHQELEVVPGLLKAELEIVEPVPDAFAFEFRPAAGNQAEPALPPVEGAESLAYPATILGPHPADLQAWPEATLTADIALPEAVTVVEERALPLWLWVILGAWALGAAIGLVRWSYAWIALRRQLRGRMELTTGSLVRTIQKDLARIGNRRSKRIRFSVSDRIQVPVAFGMLRGEVCLPVRALRELTTAQQQTMLGHELAHLLRRDPLWLTAFHLTQRILFLQPLLWVARREALIAAEELCDAWAIHRSGHRVALAECLTTVAQWMRPGQADLPVACMARPGSPLGRRVDRLLDRDSEVRPRHRAVSGSIGVGLVTSLAAMALFAPGFAGPSKEEPVAVEDNFPVITHASLLADWNLAQQRITFLQLEIDALRQESALAFPGEDSADDLRLTLSRLELQLQRLEQLSDRIRWYLSTSTTS